MYIYEGHMGSLYTSDTFLDYDDLYCEQCGDSDWLIGYAATKEEAWNLLEDSTDINGSGGWNYEYVMEFLDKNWEGDFVPTIREYMKFNCPECGSPLGVWADYLVEERPAKFDSFKYEKRELIRHCENCHCDWENEWWTEFGDVGESQLRRKFWG